MRLTKQTMVLLSLTLTLSSSSAQMLWASNPKTSAGMTLVEAAGAKPFALGEAFSSVQNDISAMGYNPASLNSLTSSQASFQYQQGMAEDSYGEFRLGLPFQKSGLGFSMGLYKGGDTVLNDGTPTRTVTAQKDMAVSLGYARTLGSMSLGLTGKYISSELAESAKASAMALDMGLQAPLSSRLKMGLALQNMGNQLKYDQKKEDLPLKARAGLSWGFFKSSQLLIDAVYSAKEKELNPAAGLEVGFGPLALRAGYQAGSDLQNFSLGTGFLINNLSLDYAFGLVQNLDSTHKMSISLRFGNKDNNKMVAIPVQKKEPEKPAITFMDRQKNGEVRQTQFKSLGNQVYEVGPRDTLGLIAKKMYGDSREWKRIYEANRHVLKGATSLEVGQKIQLP